MYVETRGGGVEGVVLIYMLTVLEHMGGAGW